MKSGATREHVEHVAVLDESGAVIGSVAKSSVHGPDTPLHLAFPVGFSTTSVRCW